MEYWRDIEELNCLYKISRDGLVVQKPRKIKSSVQPNGYRVSKEKIKKSQDNGRGYRQIYVQVNKKRTVFYVHRLVAKYFIDNTLNMPEVNHKDGNKANNSVDNLEWVTRKQNMTHAVNNGLLKNRKSGKRVKVYQILETKTILWDSIHEASVSLKIDSSAITKVCRKKNKRAGGFKWSYENTD